MTNKIRILLLVVIICLGATGFIWAEDTEMYCDKNGRCWYPSDKKDSQQSGDGDPAYQQSVIQDELESETVDTESYYSDDPYSREIRTEDRYQREKIKMQEEEAREEKMNSKFQDLDKMPQDAYNQTQVFDKIYQDNIR